MKNAQRGAPKYRNNELANDHFRPEKAMSIAIVGLGYIWPRNLTSHPTSAEIGTGADAVQIASISAAGLIVR
jgi:hypothetical protein